MCKYCSKLRELRQADKKSFEIVLDVWKRCCERQEKLLRRSLLCISVEDDKTLMADICKEISSPFIKY